MLLHMGRLARPAKAERRGRAGRPVVSHPGFSVLGRRSRTPRPRCGPVPTPGVASLPRKVEQQTGIRSADGNVKDGTEHSSPSSSGARGEQCTGQTCGGSFRGSFPSALALGSANLAQISAEQCATGEGPPSQWGRGRRRAEDTGPHESNDTTVQPHASPIRRGVEDGDVCVSPLRPPATHHHWGLRL